MRSSATYQVYALHLSHEMYVFHTATETEETLRWRACSEAVNSEDALAMKQPAPVPIQDQEGLL